MSFTPTQAIAIVNGDLYHLCRLVASYHLPVIACYAWFVVQLLTVFMRSYGRRTLSPISVLAQFVAATILGQLYQLFMVAAVMNILGYAKVQATAPDRPLLVVYVINLVAFVLLIEIHLPLKWWGVKWVNGRPRCVVTGDVKTRQPLALGIGSHVERRVVQGQMRPNQFVQQPGAVSLTKH